MMKRILSSIFLLVIITACSGAQGKRIYIANDDHTDLLWGGTEEMYRIAWLTMLDYYLDQVDSTIGNPADHQSRFNADGHYWLWTYEKNRTPVQFQRLIERIKDGHITIPLQTLVLIYGGMSAEAVLRSMYYAGRIERKYGIRFELVSAMEDQTLPFGLPSLWAGSGAKYSWKGVCGCFTRVPGLANRGREIYYAKGPDGRQVLMKWHSFDAGGTSTNTASGGYAECRLNNSPAWAIDFASHNSTFLSQYPFTDVVGMFGWGWDDFLTTTDIFVRTAKDSSITGRRVIVSNEVDFFKDYERSAPLGVTPEYSASFGNDWDLNVATMAEVTAGMKRAVEDLRTAEALATVVSTFSPSFMDSRRSSADSAFNSMGLYFEHNWNNDGPFTPQRPAFNRTKAAQIRAYVSALKADAMHTLAQAIPNPQSAKRFFVFNPLSWPRTDFADVPTTTTGEVRVTDIATGLEVPVQRISTSGQNQLRILARGVPPVGYRVYDVQAGPSSVTSPAATFSGGNSTMENDRYRLTVNGRGAITSLIDKVRGNREWAQTIDGRAINDIGIGAGTPQQLEVGPVSATIVVYAGGTPAHQTTVTLYGDIDRIDIQNEITQNFSGDPPVTSSFGFALSGQTTRHEELGAIATAKLLGNGGNYSPTSARYEYLTLNHFVDMSDGLLGITLSNWDSQFWQLGRSTLSFLDESTPMLKVVVGGRLSPATLAFSGQAGDTYFLNRYALQVHEQYDQAAAMRMALEHQNPLCAAELSPGDANLPEATYSLLSIQDSAIALWALKPAEEGISDAGNGGIIARVWNLTQNVASLQLHVVGALTAAERTTHIETNVSSVTPVNNTLVDNLTAQRMQTYRLHVQPAPTNNVVDLKALPVSIRSIRLSWGTTAENHLHGFQVERRLESLTAFSALSPGFVAAKGGPSSPASYTFLDTTASAGRYYYRLLLLDSSGTSLESAAVLGEVVTAASEVLLIPRQFALHQNYPNPFNPVTTIRYDLPRRALVRLTVMNTLGQRVATLVNSEMNAGYHEVRFDAGRLASGVYLYRLQAGEDVKTQRLVLIK